MSRLCLFWVLLFFLMIACRKKDTVWNSDWSAPLVNDSLSLDKYVKDSLLSVQSGFYELNFNRNLLDLNLTEVVTIPDTTIYKTFGIVFSNYQLVPGTSFVNSIEEHVLDAQGVQLKKIRLSGGDLKIRMENPINTPVFFKMQLVGVTLNGTTFEKTFKAPSGSMTNPGIVEGTIDLTGYEMDLTGISGAKFNILQSRFTVTTDPEGNTTSMTNNDITKISATFHALKLDYARGYFGEKIISDTIETTIDFLTKITGGTVDFPTSKLQFSLSNGLKIPAKATIAFIENRNAITNSNVALTSSVGNTFHFGEAFNLDPATGSWSTLTEAKKTILFDGITSNLEHYLENLGATQKIGYSIHLNPWGNTSGGWNELFPNSRLKVGIDYKMPLSIGVEGLSLKNTFDFSVKQNTQKTHIVAGELLLLAMNTFPLSGKVDLNLLDANGNILFTVKGSESIKSSEYGTEVTDKGLKISRSTVRYKLTSDMISKLEFVKKIMVVSTFDTPNPSTSTNISYQLPEGVFLGVKIKGDFKVENRY